jgi:hypothetical protein
MNDNSYLAGLVKVDNIGVALRMWTAAIALAHWLTVGGTITDCRKADYDKVSAYRLLLTTHFSARDSFFLLAK